MRNIGRIIAAVLLAGVWHQASATNYYNFGPSVDDYTGIAAPKPAPLPPSKKDATKKAGLKMLEARLPRGNEGGASEEASTR